MKQAFTFYEENPFEKPPHFRVQGASTMDTEALYDLFLKNLIAAVFFEDPTVVAKRSSKFFQEYPLSTHQEYYFQLFKNGSLLIGANKQLYCPIMNFCLTEQSTFIGRTDADSLCYNNFISSHLVVFQRIQLLTQEQVNPEASSDFLTYLNNYDIFYSHVNLALVGKELENLFIKACEECCVSYVHFLNESGFKNEKLEEVLKSILIAMKLDLLEVEEQRQLITHSKRWLQQRFKEFVLLRDMYYPLHKTKGPFLFDPVLQYFSQYFESHTKAATHETQEVENYPTHIFTSYKGYQLFDTLAKGLYTKASISYVYRLLFEKGLISAKDTPFREWYNQQGYPIQLLSTTETLVNSKSTDREQFVRIVAKLVEVTL